MSRHQGRTRRRAGRVNVEIRQADALLVELVEIRRLDNRVAVAAQIAVALVVGYHQNNVRPLSLRPRRLAHPGTARQYRQRPRRSRRRADRFQKLSSCLLAHIHTSCYSTFEKWHIVSFTELPTTNYELRTILCRPY